MTEPERAQPERAQPERVQCKPCPWRDLADPAFSPAVLEAARAGEVFVCHTRMGPCPGPTLAGLR